MLRQAEKCFLWELQARMKHGRLTNCSVSLLFFARNAANICHNSFRLCVCVCLSVRLQFPACLRACMSDDEWSALHDSRETLCPLLAEWSDGALGIGRRLLRDWSSLCDLPSPLRAMKSPNGRFHNHEMLKSDGHCWWRQGGRWNGFSLGLVPRGYDLGWA